MHGGPRLTRPPNLSLRAVDRPCNIAWGVAFPYVMIDFGSDSPDSQLARRCIFHFVWGVDFHHPDISWQSGTCQLHATHLSAIYDYETGDGEGSPAIVFQTAMMSYDVDVFAAPASTTSKLGDSFRVCVHAATCAACKFQHAVTVRSQRE